MTEKFWSGGDVLASALLAEAKRLSEEFPERIGRSDTDGCVYTQYEYNHGDETSEPVCPVCIVGTAIFNVTGGYVPPVYEGNRIATDLWMEALGVRNLNSDHPERQAWGKLYDAQSMQDRRVPWGKLFQDEESGE